ncbi:hypothetical protein [Aliagarivorans taiwanensis]|uniref:hypothetical protein n=1 Tax=Aliagarivorans taiwanensis TaxID=561966 RepID=UPI0003FF0A48|nr:hypothetical protein [Aliagarivorans taiwanensis]
MKLLLNATIDTLEQVKQLIGFASGPLYNQPSAHSQSGIGRHVRHILDHFWALQLGMEQGVIDYNQRQRDSALEQQPDLALARCQQLIEWLDGQIEQDNPLQVISEISVHEQQNIEVSSLLSRELLYLINHTIHHIAYAKLLGQQLGLQFDAALGLAPSTASYLRGQG